VQRYAAQVEEVARELLAALQRFIEWHGAAHTDNCPTDDTCICDGAAYNNAVNAAIQRATTLLGDPPACLDPCAVCGKSLEEHPRCPKCGYSKCDAGMWLDHGRCRCSGTLLASAGESTGEATDSKT
jgi:hypothetical protein